MRTFANFCILIVFSSLCLPALAKEGCSKIPDNAVELLRTYSEKNGNSADIFSVAAIGNQDFMLDENYTPVSPENLAAIISQVEKYKSASSVLLVWPYSAMHGSFPPALEKIVHKPVMGFSGPMWWYADGSAVSIRPEKSADKAPSASNVAECLGSDGKYYQGDACKSFVKKHKSVSRIFGNVAFAISCDELRQVNELADSGNARANLRLYFDSYFVNVDKTKALHYLSKSAALGDPIANYIVAESVRDSNPQLYRQTLEIAAKGGMEKAKTELASLSNP